MTSSEVGPSVARLTSTLRPSNGRPPPTSRLGNCRWIPLAYPYQIGMSKVVGWNSTPKKGTLVGYNVVFGGVMASTCRSLLRTTNHPSPLVLAKAAAAFSVFTHPPLPD